MKLPIKVDYGLAMITRTDTKTSVRAWPRVLDVVQVLMDAWPAFVSVETMGDRLVGRDDFIPNETVRVHISRARRTMEPLGAKIEGRHGIGWRLAVAEEAGLPIVLPASMTDALTRLASAGNTTINEIVRRQVAAMLEMSR